MELTFDNFKELNVNVNRCMGYTKSGKKCRTRLRNNQYLFCCEDHKPYNAEILEEGCFCCMEKIINHKDGLFFKCKHLVHKSCYIEWSKSENNTYEVPICILCREIVYKKDKKKRSLPYKNESESGKSASELLENFIEKSNIDDEEYKKSIKKFEYAETFPI